MFGGFYAWLDTISWFALIQTNLNPSSKHVNVRSNFLTLNNQVLRAETTYVQYFRSINLQLKPHCPWAHRSVRQGNMGALLIRPLCLQHIYRAMRWISQLGHSACFHPWCVGHSVYLPSNCYIYIALLQYNRLIIMKYIMLNFYYSIV